MNSQTRQTLTKIRDNLDDILSDQCNCSEDLVNSVEKGCVECAERYLQDTFRQAYSEGFHLQNTCAKYAHVEVFELLVVNATFNVDNRDNNGETPLLIATRYGRKEFAYRALEKGADPRNAICEAINRGYCELAKTMVEHI